MNRVAAGASDSDATHRLGVVAAAVPLLVVGTSAMLWWISDRLLYIGPLDRATFGWAVVVPIWAVAPLAAGFAWRHHTARARSINASLSALALGSVAAVLYWLSVVSPTCQFGPVRAAGELVLPAVALGAVIGGGFALSCLVASRLVRSGRPTHALLAGAIGQLALIAAATMLFWSLSIGGLCRLPSG
jgi:hypothetical protein